MQFAARQFLEPFARDPLRGPWAAFSLGCGGMALVVALAWLASGDPLDATWLRQSALCVVAGFFLSGFSARVGSAREKTWLLRLLATASSALLAAIAIWASAAVWGDAVRNAPIATLAISAGVATILHHVLLGALALLASAPAHVVRLLDTWQKA